MDELTELSEEEIAYLQSMPSLEFRKWLDEVSEVNPKLAAKIKRRVEGQIISKAEVCELFTIAPQTLELWQRSGMPLAAKKGRNVYFDLKDVCTWIGHRKVVKVGDDEGSKSDQKFNEERARIQELKRRQLEGALVDKNAHFDQLEDLLDGIRTGVQAFQSRFGSEASEMLNDVVDEAVKRILDKRSNGSTPVID